MWNKKKKGSYSGWLPLPNCWAFRLLWIFASLIIFLRIHYRGGVTWPRVELERAWLQLPNYFLEKSGQSHSHQQWASITAHTGQRTSISNIFVNATGQKWALFQFAWLPITLKFSFFFLLTHISWPSVYHMAEPQTLDLLALWLLASDICPALAVSFQMWFWITQTRVSQSQH